MACVKYVSHNNHLLLKYNKERAREADTNNIAYIVNYGLDAVRQILQYIAMAVPLEGLSKNEQRMYEVLLTKGERSGADIIKETSLARGVGYFVLDALVEKGLASKSYNGRTALYAPSHPSHLLDLVNQKLATLQKEKSLLTETLPNLIELFNKHTSNPSLFFYDGADGVKKVYEDTLIQGDTIYAILQSGEIDPSILKWIRTTYIKKRIKQGIFAHVILAEDQQTTRYIGESAEKLREVTTVSKEEFPIQMELNIYGNKVGFISYHKDSPHFGVIIESQFVASTMLALWKLARVGAGKTAIRSYTPQSS